MQRSVFSLLHIHEVYGIVDYTNIYAMAAKRFKISNNIDIESYDEVRALPAWCKYGHKDVKYKAHYNIITRKAIKVILQFTSDN